MNLLSSLAILTVLIGVCRAEDLETVTVDDVVSRQFETGKFRLESEFTGVLRLAFCDLKKSPFPERLALDFTHAMFHKRDGRINGILGRSCLLAPKLKTAGFLNQLAASPCELPDANDLATFERVEQYEEVFGELVFFDYSGPIGGKYSRDYCGFEKIDEESIRIVLVRLVASGKPGLPANGELTIHNRILMEGTFVATKADGQHQTIAEPSVEPPSPRRP